MRSGRMPIAPLTLYLLPIYEAPKAVLTFAQILLWFAFPHGRQLDLSRPPRRKEPANRASSR